MKGEEGIKLGFRNCGMQLIRRRKRGMMPQGDTTRRIPNIDSPAATTTEPFATARRKGIREKEKTHKKNSD